MKRLLLVAIVFACCAPAWAAPAPDLQFVVFGRVDGVQGRKLSFTQQNGQSGTIELSPTVVFHDATQPPPALVDVSALHPGDIIVLATDAQRRTHLIIANPRGRPQRDWDALFARIVPGYKSLYAGQMHAAPSGGGQGGNGAVHGQLKMVMIGKVAGLSSGTVVVRRSDGQSATVTLPPNVVFHDLSEPSGASASFEAIHEGDDIVMTSDASEQPHVLFLHAGQTMNPSWRGMVAK
jgi:hypothetical protein